MHLKIMSHFQKMKLIKNKKGNFADIPEYIRGALLFGFALVIVVLFLTNFNTQIQSMDNETIPEITKNATSSYTAQVGPSFDILSAFMLLFFIIISVVSARLIPSSPKFIVIAIIALILLSFVAMIIENVWDSWINNSSVAGVISQLKFTNFILNNLTIVTIIYTLLVAVALFTKSEQTL
jgi:hypothetical protein